MRVPKSTSQKELKRIEENFIRHTKKPDADNLIKFYIDCLDGIIFEGDQKVEIGQVIRLKSKKPCVMIFIEEVEEELSVDDFPPWIMGVLKDLNSSTAEKNYSQTHC